MKEKTDRQVKREKKNKCTEPQKAKPLTPTRAIDVFKRDEEQKGKQETSYPPMTSMEHTVNQF